MDIIYRLAAVAALLAASAGLGYVKGLQHESDRHADYRAAVEAAHVKTAADSAAKLAAATANTRTVAQLYAGHAAAVAAGYRSRLNGLLHARSDCAASAETARPAESLDGRSSDAGPTASTLDQAVQRLDSDCASTTLRFVGLRAYVEGLCQSYGCEGEK